MEISDARAPWKEVIAIRTVKNFILVSDEEELRNIFWDMTEISTDTETEQVMEIVETVDEYGSIVETETAVDKTVLYITVTHKSIEEMAEKYGFDDDQKQLLTELLDEASSGYWESFGAGDSELVEVAISQVGNVGGELYWSWYGFDHRVEWCACFVSWCANKCGYIEAGIIPKFSSCTIGSQWFKERGLWKNGDYIPGSGDLIFFDWGDENGQDGAVDHVGIVERVEDGIIYTIEGNSGNRCRREEYDVGHYEIYGYGLVVT